MIYDEDWIEAAMAIQEKNGHYGYSVSILFVEAGKLTGIPDRSVISYARAQRGRISGKNNLW